MNSCIHVQATVCSTWTKEQATSGVSCRGYPHSPPSPPSPDSHTIKLDHDDQLSSSVLGILHTHAPRAEQVPICTTCRHDSTPCHHHLQTTGELHICQTPVSFAVCRHGQSLPEHTSIIRGRAAEGCRWGLLSRQDSRLTASSCARAYSVDCAIDPMSGLMPALLSTWPAEVQVHVIITSLDQKNWKPKSTIRSLARVCERLNFDHLSRDMIPHIHFLLFGSDGALFAALQISACAMQMRLPAFLWLHYADSRRCEPSFLPSFPFAPSTIQIDNKTSRPFLFFQRNLGGFPGQYPDSRRWIAGWRPSVGVASFRAKT